MKWIVAARPGRRAHGRGGVRRPGELSAEPCQPQRAAIQTGAPDPHAVDVYDRWLKRQRKDFQTNFHLRILQDLLNAPGRTDGVFLALINGRKNPPALAAVDPDGVEALHISPRLGGEDTLFWVVDSNRGGLWYLCDRREEVARRQPSPEKRLADALDYRIETEVERDADIVGQATLRFQTLVDGLRVLPVNLMPKLRIGEASYAVETAGAEPAWKPLAWIQEEEKTDADAAVVFPEPARFRTRGGFGLRGPAGGQRRRGRGQLRPDLHDLLRPSAPVLRGHHAAGAVVLRPVLAVADLPALRVVPDQHPARRPGPEADGQFRESSGFSRVRPPVVGPPGGRRHLPRSVAGRGLRRVLGSSGRAAHPGLGWLLRLLARLPQIHLRAVPGQLDHE